MSSRKSSNQKNDKPDTSVTVAKIGIITALITVLGVISVPLFNYLSKNKEVSVQATQMAQFINFTAIALTDVAHNTTEATLIPISPTPLSISTETVSPAITTDATSTTTTNLLTTSGLSNNCIDTTQWTPYKLNINSDRCWSPPDSWRMSIKENELSVSIQNNENAELNYALYRALQGDATIQFDINISQMDIPGNQTINIAFGIIGTNPVQALSTGLFYQKENSSFPILLKPTSLGEVYFNDNNNQRRTFTPDRLEKVKIQVAGFRLIITVDEEIVLDSPIDFGPEKRAFWIGYTVPGKGILRFEISNLSIQEK